VRASKKHGSKLTRHMKEGRRNRVSSPREKRRESRGGANWGKRCESRKEKHIHHSIRVTEGKEKSRKGPDVTKKGTKRKLPVTAGKLRDAFQKGNSREKREKELTRYQEKKRMEKRRSRAQARNAKKTRTIRKEKKESRLREKRKETNCSTGEARFDTNGERRTRPNISYNAHGSARRRLHRTVAELRVRIRKK